MSSPIETELAQYNYLKEQLRLQFPDEDDESLADTLDGESDLKEALARVLRSAEPDIGMVAAIANRIDELKERSTRLEARAEAKYELVRSVMERAGIKKIQAYDMTISLRAVAPNVIIVDESQIPSHYFRSPAVPEPRPDRSAIRHALTGGVEVPGCVLGNGSNTISVRKS
jgi:hypothetical protein